MGEVTVGGSEVVKNARDDDAGFDLKKISSSRMRNVAKAYAWWIAKDVVNTSILKVRTRPPLTRQETPSEPLFHRRWIL
jgi:hypothetical protein